VGTALVGVMFTLFDKTIAWKLAMIASAALVAVHGTIVYFFLAPDPKQCGYTHEAIGDAQPDVADATSSEMHLYPLSEKSSCIPFSRKKEGKGISFLEAWCIPGVIPYAMSYACLKSVNYALFFWLPFYLTVSLQMDNSTADFFSVMYIFL
jgi:OPA family glycerol-3-phosphate transporter-like MFS transporter 3